MKRIRMLAVAAVTAVLGFGVDAATATPAAKESFSCPGYMSSAEACRDCCANWYGAYGLWSPSNGYCACAL